MVNTFKDKNIVQCDVSIYHGMFLTDTGVVWSCGYWNDGRLGLGLNDHEDEFHQLKQI